MANQILTERLTGATSPTAVEEPIEGKTGYWQQEEARPVPSEQLTVEAGRTPTPLPLWRLLLIVASTTLVSLLNSFPIGLLMIVSPAITRDLAMPPGLALWTGSANFLTLGVCLLPLGAVADVVGAGRVNLAGTAALALLTLGCGFACSPTQLIVLRALAGVAGAMIKPTAISILSTSLATVTPVDGSDNTRERAVTYAPGSNDDGDGNVGKGKKFATNNRLRSFGFACFGLSMPLGVVVGQVLGGWIQQDASLGWRLSFYLCSATLAVCWMTNFFILPADEVKLSRAMMARIAYDIDWVGAVIFGAAFAVLSYVFSFLIEDVSHIRKIWVIVLVCIGILLLPTFFLWMSFQESRNRPALIVNSLWRRPEFTALCLTILLADAALNGMEWFLSIYIQIIQGLSPLATAIRFLPDLILGIILQLTMGLFCHRLPIFQTVTVAAIVTAVSPLIMAFVQPDWSYWRGIFLVILLLPVMIDDVFAAKDQALAGAVLSIVSQLGQSLGITLLALIGSGIDKPSNRTAAGEGAEPPSYNYSLAAFHAMFWVCFGLGVAVIVVAGVGFRRRRFIAS